MPKAMSAPQTTAATPRRRLKWILEDRHGALLRGRLAAYLMIAVIAAAGVPEGMSTAQRELAVAMCLVAAAVQTLLWLAPIWWPKRLLDSVNGALIVDALLIFGLAVVSNGCESLALWALPVMALAATVAHGLSTGVKALILAAIVVGAVQWTDADGSAERTAGPLIMAAIVVVVAGGLIRVNERHLRAAEDQQSVLFSASRRFVGVDDPAELRRIAEVAAQRLLPGGWEARVDLDDRDGHDRQWRDGEWAHLALPLVQRERDRDDRVLGALTARRHAPRVGSVRISVRHALPALQALALALTNALSHTELVAQLAHLSRSDPLTALGNRRAFDEAVVEELARARRSGAPLGLVMLDVDHFKRFNDRHGHQEGDEALVAVARVLGEVARTEDRACRVGGEEFAVLLPGADEGASLAVAERIRAGVAAAAAAEPITVSLGVAATRGEHDAGALFALADEALYAAKQAGRNRSRGPSLSGG
jgi:diguanylate cyclase (GGDEF)-like protein